MNKKEYTGTLRLMCGDCEMRRSAYKDKRSRKKIMKQWREEVVSTQKINYSIQIMPN